ncbi:sulfur transferase domain-containing protein [Nostoc sp. PCC 7107]|uniref:beta-lactamase hydrolase domain-containing protein n=1 Tax=Nostoc sp. PCC 7107 TaxID=317936 RepID=UPI00029F40AB|nr:sulfur transferase domain-containing protein [Nostoc sp. PCC 7107]AFY43841.1 Beta-lactamase hydrolase-family protein [Nostoc sp. PCC 7107]
MSNSKKVSENLSTAGQVTNEELQQLAQAGFKSVLNLRSPDEAGFLNDEQQQAQEAGLEYANVPLKPSQADKELTELAIEKIDNLPKPILIHCAAGARAGGIALIATAVNEGLTYEQITQKASELGINLEQPHLKQFLLDKYIADQAEKA